ncbi:MAG: GNAT family N-acetyltransferase [Bacteroidota bacterium]
MVNRNFTPFPILTTERLTLRQLSTDDQQNIFALRSDTEINKYLNREPSKTIEDAINFINKVNDNIKNNNSIYWVISLTTTKTFVGTICLFDFSDETIMSEHSETDMNIAHDSFITDKNNLYTDEKSSCEIGYELMTKFQGQGIMKEAIEKVIHYAFQTLQFQKIVAFTHNGNQNSTKLLAKFNFLQSEEADKENPDLNIFILTHSH